MIKQSFLEELLSVALSTGGDFSEVYAEHTRNHTIQFVNGKIDKLNDTVLSGVGIRIFKGERTVYASTSDLSREGLLACARSAADAMGEGNAPISISLTKTAVIDRHPILYHPCTSDLSQRIDLLKAGCVSAKEYDPRIAQVQGWLLGVDREILVANSEGLFKEEEHNRSCI